MERKEKSKQYRNHSATVLESNCLRLKRTPSSHTSMHLQIQSFEQPDQVCYTTMLLCITTIGKNDTMKQQEKKKNSR